MMRTGAGRAPTLSLNKKAEVEFSTSAFTFPLKQQGTMN
jgi:hypothetical protein